MRLSRPVAAAVWAWLLAAAPLPAQAPPRTHDITLDTTNAMRDSDGQIYKVGTTFVFSPKLTGEISVGRTQRSYRDPHLQNVNGPLVDGSVLFLPNPLTARSKVCFKKQSRAVRESNCE